MICRIARKLIEEEIQYNTSFTLLELFIFII